MEGGRWAEIMEGGLEKILGWTLHFNYRKIFNAKEFEYYSNVKHDFEFLLMYFAISIICKFT
jgi:hypothetical protein